MRQPRRIAVVGAGFMGAVIATLYAAKGFEVALFDAAPDVLASYRERGMPTATSLAGDAESGRQLVQRVRLAASLAEAVAGADLVHETIQENLEAKQALLRELDGRCGPQVVLATNTSSFRISHLCAGVVHPQRVLGIHFVTPAHIVRAVEVITTAANSPEQVAWACAFVESIDHVPLACRESPGFLVNRIQLALLAEVHRIVDEGLASVEDVDAAVRLSLGPRWALWGALACEDLVSSKKTALAMLQYMHEQTGQEQFRPTRALAGLVEQGRLGAASGHGWYEWPAPYGELAMERDRQLAETLDWLSSRKDIR